MNLQVIFSVVDSLEELQLCFKHATEAATKLGNVLTEVREIGYLDSCVGCAHCAKLGEVKNGVVCRADMIAGKVSGFGRTGCRN